ncbi:MAG: hypothetical protein [Microvirus sp.]|nr:MAG: hypothetical protein [Microvirus sp.]
MKNKTQFPKLQDKRLYVLQPSHMETNVGVSETVPDDTLTIKQIMLKHVRGMQIEDSMYRTPMYDDDANFDSPDLEALGRLDLTERHEMAQQLKQQNEESEADLKTKIQAAKAAKKAERDKKSLATQPREATDAVPSRTTGHAAQVPVTPEVGEAE